MSKTEKYAKALDELEALHAAGKISDSKYELHRTQLLTEHANGTAGPIARLAEGMAKWIFIGFAALVVLLAIASIVLH